jgi:Tfp pilus assembly protein FimV
MAMAMAIFEANSNAFFGSNINNLRLGAVLTVPTLGDGASYAQREQTFQRHMSGWGNG